MVEIHIMPGISPGFFMFKIQNQNLKKYINERKCFIL